MTVRMLFFAHLGDAAGGPEAMMDLPEGASVETAASELAKRWPVLSSLLDHVRVAVNAEFARPETLLSDGDEVAWMPPMSGGAFV